MANINQTTLSGAITVNQTVIPVASATYLSAPTNGFYQKIYVIDPGSTRGELMSVQAVNGLQIAVSRLDEFKCGHVSGAIVLIENVDPTQPAVFQGHNPNTVPRETTPVNSFWINVVTGEQWIWSTVTNTWVPGFNNTSAPLSPTAAITATAAVLPAPSGPLCHVAASSTPAVTGITTPLGFTSGSFTVIPDAAFTWTTGDGSIAVGGTAVQYRALTFTYDFAAAKWYPSYV